MTRPSDSPLHHGPWVGHVPEPELAELADAGFGARGGLGQRPCLLVVDVVTSFLGDPASTDGMGCGEVGRQRLPSIVATIEVAREAGVPVVFTRGDAIDKRFVGGSIKRTRGAEIARRVHESPFPEEIDPRDAEYVLSKPKASAFFGTPLASYLFRMAVDTVVLVGTTTSGCIRATAVDAASLDLYVAVVSDACFDRSSFAHAANLFDIQCKYGDVLDRHEAAAYLQEADGRRPMT